MSEDLRQARAGAAARKKYLREHKGLDVNKANDIVIGEFGLQFPGQARVSTGGSEVDILVRRPGGGETREEFMNLRLSPQGERALKKALRVREVDHYNEYVDETKYVDWFTENPYGVIIGPDGTVTPWWGPHGP